MKELKSAKTNLMKITDDLDYEIRHIQFEKQELDMKGTQENKKLENSFS